MRRITHIIIILIVLIPSLCFAGGRTTKPFSLESLFSLAGDELSLSTNLTTLELTSTYAHFSTVAVTGYQTVTGNSRVGSLEVVPTDGGKGFQYFAPWTNQGPWSSRIGSGFYTQQDESGTIIDAMFQTGTADAVTRTKISRISVVKNISEISRTHATIANRAVFSINPTQTANWMIFVQDYPNKPPTGTFLSTCNTEQGEWKFVAMKTQIGLATTGTDRFVIGASATEYQYLHALTGTSLTVKRIANGKYIILDTTVPVGSAITAND